MCGAFFARKKMCQLPSVLAIMRVCLIRFGASDIFLVDFYWLSSSVVLICKPKLELELNVSLFCFRCDCWYCHAYNFFPSTLATIYLTVILRAKTHEQQQREKTLIFPPKRVEWHLKYTAIKKDLLYIYSMCLSNEVEASGSNNSFISFVILSFNFVIFLAFFFLLLCRSLTLSCSLAFVLIRSQFALCVCIASVLLSAQWVGTT